ncbi:urea carboxylase-associated family protein [Amycolatopsis roodepoortensis]|uniref:urea carboxylase-associated family protein n=1 Tax=Amycolatopsis roodepoortensis TaxID=700274 RepID=UPI00214B216E|nr:urea carboxylase-associated family protein [Amycolatopsis roodepoortensis]UUV30993.1 urea carboxylase-associated family protein [Amycolatopsis roodepoortensis]
MSRTEVPPGTARAVRVAAGDLVRVIDVDGGQVGDVFAFRDGGGTELTEHHSAAHTRAGVDRLFPAVGESFLTDLRRPILTLIEDTSPGEHDMLVPACDPARYAALGAPGHRSCAANLREALTNEGLGFTGPTPQPINVFMRVPVGGDGRLNWLTANSRPGDAVTLRAELDCVVVVSACPQDLVRISDAGLSPLAIETVHNGGNRS